jgi:hypothetical protein
MPSDVQLDVRPRSTGEILDDAWRLVLADAPVLFALSSVFILPAAGAILFLLTYPPAGHWWGQLLWPAVAAVLLPLTGLGSAACQEAFRARAEEQPLQLGRCLAAALRRGLDHSVARAVITVLAILGLPLLLMPGLAVWVGSAAVHPLLVGGEVHWGEALRRSGRETQRHPVKAAVVVLSRLPLLAVTVINLHLLIRSGLWILDQLAGFDMALPQLVLTPTNPVYDLALVLAGWLLLAPYFEACNYLLHVDARVRYEGLDLWYRAQRLFPSFERGRALVPLLAIGAALLAVVPVHAEDTRLTAVRAARQEIAHIMRQAATAKPYRGAAWQAPLEEMAQRLNRDGSTQPNRYRWFDQAIEGFHRLDRTAGLAVLAELDRRLALVEEGLALQEQGGAAGVPRSREDIKSLLPPESPETTQPKEKEKPRRPEETEVKRPVHRDDTDGERVRRGRGGAVMGPQSFAGLDTLTWMLLAGLVAAVVVFLVMHLRERKARPKLKPAKIEVATAPDLEDALTQADRYTVDGMWRQADELARTGRFLDAVRTLYLGVLALLHRANLIRYERTRTNGEYAQQLRSRTGLHGPFQGLTLLFEVKWYGERSCQPADYSRCRGLAEDIRVGVKAEQ